MDFMAIGAHPDDVEIMAGGTVAKLVQQGYMGGIVDLSAGEMGTRGTVEERQKESEKAAEILGVSFRECLHLPDGNIQNELENRLKVVALIRKYRPKILLTHAELEEHPDHKATSHLVQDAAFLSGVTKFGQENLENVEGSFEERLPLLSPFRPTRIFHFLGFVDQKPSFCVDISEQMDVKMESILSHASQFYNKKDNSPKYQKTDLASPEFLEHIQVRNRYYGIQIKKKYAEPFVCKEFPEVQDLVALGGKRFS